MNVKVEISCFFIIVARISDRASRTTIILSCANKVYGGVTLEREKKRSDVVYGIKYCEHRVNWPGISGI